MILNVAINIYVSNSAIYESRSKPNLRSRKQGPLHVVSTGWSHSSHWETINGRFEGTVSRTLDHLRRWRWMACTLAQSRPCDYFLWGCLPRPVLVSVNCTDRRDILFVGCFRWPATMKTSITIGVVKHSISLIQLSGVFWPQAHHSILCIELGYYEGGVI